jgi:hypothetical protein
MRHTYTQYKADFTFCYKQTNHEKKTIWQRARSAADTDTRSKWGQLFLCLTKHHAMKTYPVINYLVDHITRE